MVSVNNIDLCAADHGESQNGKRGGITRGRAKTKETLSMKCYGFWFATSLRIRIDIIPFVELLPPGRSPGCH